MSFNLVVFITYFISTTPLEIKNCNYIETCACNGGDDCQIDCTEWQGCVDAQLNCPNGYNCTINCSGSESCKDAVIHAQNSHNTKLLCPNYKSCFTTTLLCPNGYNCHTECTGSTEVCQNMIINGSLASSVSLDCDYAMWRLCNGITIHCGTTCNIWCNGTSTNEEVCTAMQITTTNTLFFNLNCDGDTSCVTNSWVNTLAPTTSLPTTYMPSTSTPTTYTPTTFHPTTLVPTTSIPTTLMPTTFHPTSTIPTTLIPTTNMPTFVPITSVPTSNISTTFIPTTTIPTTSIPKTTNNVATDLPSRSPTNDEDGVTDFDSTVVKNELIENENDNVLGMTLVLVIAATFIVVIIVFCIFIILKRKRQVKVSIDNKSTVEMHGTNTNNSSKLQKNGSRHVTNGTLGRNLQSMITGNELMMEDIINDVDNVQQFVVTKGGDDANEPDSTMRNSIDDDNLILDGITLGGDNENNDTSEGDNINVTPGNMDALVDTESADTDEEIEITTTGR